MSNSFKPKYKRAELRVIIHSPQREWAQEIAAAYAEIDRLVCSQKENERLRVSIEKYAYKTKIMRETLKWYAQELHYGTTPRIEHDRGVRALDALEKVK